MKYDLYIPSYISPPIIPHQILILPNSDGMELLLCYNDEGVYVNTYGQVTRVRVYFCVIFSDQNLKESILTWGEHPLSVSQIKSSNEVMGWGEKVRLVNFAQKFNFETFQQIFEREKGY